MKKLRRSSRIILRKSTLTCCKAELAFFVSSFYQVFFSRISRFTGQQGKGEAISLTPLYYCCRELTSAHSWQPDSNKKPLVSYRKSLSTKLRALSTLALIADIVRSMLKTRVTLANIPLVLLNLIKSFIFVMFKLLHSMFTQLTIIFFL